MADIIRSMADTPLRNFRCSNKLWNALRRIAEDRGKELSLEPGKLMSSLVRVAIEQYIERYNAAKKTPGDLATK